jgi:hypothetical protein
MIAGITLENGNYGRRAVLNSGWGSKVVECLTKNKVVELVLNQAKGWRGNDLSFLSVLRNLKLFEIFDLNIKDISPIHTLTKVRRLGVTTYCSTEIRFSAFPFLESCALEWRPKAASLFDCGTLKALSINRYSGKDVASFARLADLEALAILNAPVENFHGLSALKQLRSLRLAGLKRLTSLAGIEALEKIEELEIHTCRAITSIAEIKHLSLLKKLHLNNVSPVGSKGTTPGRKWSLLEIQNPPPGVLV